MERTYNVFVDNGLYVISYYLKKSIRDLTIEDIKNSSKQFTNKICELLQSDRFRCLAYSTHLNSAYTRNYTIKPTNKEDKDEREKISKEINKRKKEAILNQFEGLLNNIGNDKTCLICGKKQVNLSIDIDKKYIPGIVAGSFYNSSNNLNSVDICPICLYLSMISILNIQTVSKYKLTKKNNEKKRGIGVPTLYISDSNLIMEEYTEEIQRKVQSEKILDIEECKDDKYFLDSIIQIYVDKNNLKKIDNCKYITLVRFCNNPHKGEYIEESHLEEKGLKFLLDLFNTGKKKDILSFELIDSLKENKLMIFKLLNKKNHCLKCEKETYKKVRNFEMNEKELKITKNITKVLFENNDLKSIDKNFENIRNEREFTEFIIENLKEIPNIILSLEDLNHVKRNWVKFKNYILAEWFLLLKK